MDAKYTYLNGKVNGVHTGIDLASHEHIVLADDDIRYTAADLARACVLLERYEIVRPQNYLAPLPWWVRTDSARMLMFRGTLRAGDYSGTCAFRRSTCLRVGHYDGDVLLDNEELVRHFAVKGAAILCDTAFFILKHPPGFRKWLEQRPRQRCPSPVETDTIAPSSIPCLRSLSVMPRTSTAVMNAKGGVGRGRCG